MAKIKVDIIAPSDFLPPEDLDFDRWEQYLTFALASHFPPLIQGLLDEHPYLDGLDVPYSVEAEYRPDERWTKHGWWVIIHIDKDHPGDQQTWVRLRTALELAIHGWLLSKHYKSAFMSLELKWKGE